MTNTNKPLVYHIDKKTIELTGKHFVIFLLMALERATGKIPSTLYSVKRLEPLFLNDEQGQEFWCNELASHILEYRLKEDYDIELHNYYYQKTHEDLFVVVIRDVILFESEVMRLLDDLIDPNKKYLLYRMFIKTYRTMSLEERLAYHEKEIREEIARKKSGKK